MSNYKLTIQQHDGNIEFSIQPEKNFDDAEFAFYILRDQKKIHSQWYSKKSKILFNTEKIIGQYQAHVFVKQNQSIKRIKSPPVYVNALEIDTPAFDLSKLNQSIKVQPMQLEEIISIHRMVIGGNYDLVKSSGYIPRPGAKPVQYAIPFAWKHSDRNTAFQIHAWRFLNPFFQKFIHTKDSKYISEALSYMRDWHDFENRESYSFCWYDMATGLRAIAIGFIISLEKAGHIDLSDDDRDFLNLLSYSHKANLANRKNITAGNHAIHQIIGLRIISCATNDPYTENYCNKLLTDLIDEAFDRNNVNTENSPSYHKYNIDLIKKINPSLFPKITPRLREVVLRASEILGWMTDYNGDFYRVGDSEGKGPVLKWNGPPDALDLPGKFIHNDLHESGYIFIRSTPETPHHEAAALVFHATNKSHVHAHADHLSFILIHRGSEVFTDTGKYTYEYGSWRDYVSSDVAHNTLGLDGYQFFPADTPVGSARLRALSIEGSSYLLEGNVARGNSLETSRVIRYTPGAQVLITDSVINKTANSVVLRFHLGVGLTAKPNRLGYKIYREGAVLAEITIDKNNFISSRITKGWVSKVYKAKEEIETINILYTPDTKTIETRVDLF